MRTRFAIALTTVALLLTACHGTWLANGGVYWLSSQECADGVASVTIRTPSLAYSYIEGSSGSFYADPNGCHPQARDVSTVQVQVNLYKYNEGICFPGSGWHSNPQGIYVAQVNDPITYICGSGNYYTGANNYVDLILAGVVTHFTISPGDTY